jgi:hypothetical protein
VYVWLQIPAIVVHGSGIDDGHRHGAIAGLHREILLHIVEFEFKRIAGDRISGGEDIDVVVGVGIERVEVGSTLRVLEGNVVGDQCHEIRAARFVTPESIHVGTIETRHAPNEGRFAVTRRRAVS